MPLLREGIGPEQVDREDLKHPQADAERERPRHEARQSALRCGSRRETSSQTPAKPATTTTVAATPGPGRPRPSASPPGRRDVEGQERPEERSRGRLHGRLRCGGSGIRPGQAVHPDQDAPRSRVASSSSGSPTTRAYQGLELEAVLRNWLDTRRAMPSVCAADFGDPDPKPAITPRPPTRTSASGNCQRNSLKADAAAMIPPPTSTSVSTISKTASSDEWFSRPACARSANFSARAADRRSDHPARDQGPDSSVALTVSPSFPVAVSPCIRDRSSGSCRRSSSRTRSSARPWRRVPGGP